MKSLAKTIYIHNQPCGCGVKEGISSAGWKYLDEYTCKKHFMKQAQNWTNLTNPTREVKPLKEKV